MIDASLVKELREKTGAGMMDCKKALIENEGNIDNAIKWLRTKGLSTAAKKSDRVAAEGLVAVCVKDKTGVIIEVNSETDFVSRNSLFQNLVSDLASVAIKNHNIDALKLAKMENGKSVSDQLVESISSIGENLTLRRVAAIEVNEGVVASYVHNGIAVGMGNIAALIGLESTGDKNKLEQLGKQLAMHVAASNPQVLAKEDVNAKDIENEKEIFIEQSRSSGKPDNIIEKMVEGRIRKFVEEIALLEQIFIIDGKSKVREIIEQAAKDIGAPITISKFVRFKVGEGIEQEEKNFADEVAAAIKR